MNSLTRTQQLLLFALAGVFIIVASFFYWHYLTAPKAAVIQPPPDNAPATAAADEAGKNPPEPKEVVVHVAGAVVKSGVYRLPEGSRVIDAVEAAGGAAADADVDALNLAEPLVDGRKVWVPKPGELLPEGAAASGSASSAQAGGKVNINSAGLAELQTLPRIGPALAQRIIDYRAANGPFRSIEDLKNVSGIGEKTFEGLKDLITIY